MVCTRLALLYSCLFALLPKCKSALHDEEQTEQSSINSFELFLATVLTQCMSGCIREDLSRTHPVQSRTPPQWRQSVVWNRSCEGRVAAGHLGCRRHALWRHSWRRPCGSGCMGNASSSSSPGQRLQMLSQASCLDAHLMSRPERDGTDLETEYIQVLSLKTPVVILLGPAVVFVCASVRKLIRLRSSPWLCVCVLKKSDLEKPSFVF